MGWNGSLTASSAVGAAITYTPDTTTRRGYTVGAFTAPKKGIYQFIVRGSSGMLQRSWSQTGNPGDGGYTVGYILMEAGQVVYVGAGGELSAAFVSSVWGDALKNIAPGNLYFVAGAGGGNGNSSNGWGSHGGAGGGLSGADGGLSGAETSSNYGHPGTGGTQTSGYAYGAGQDFGGYENKWDTSFWGGYGGDGFYGGTGGGGFSGGAGGSGYIHTTYCYAGSKTFQNWTQQGGGASMGGSGSVTVTYYAKSELPVIFDGTTLEKLIFNGVEIESLIYNGTKLLFERLRKEITAWSMWTKAARFLRALT